jgi:hypothetical protein
MSEKNRGEYCQSYKTCLASKSDQLTPDICWTCNDFYPIFKNVDPLKFHKILFQKPISEKEKPMSEIGEKICTKCQQPKPADKKHFFGNKINDDLLCNWCKVCHNKSSRKNKKPSKKKSKKNPTGKESVKKEAIKKKSQTPRKIIQKTSPKKVNRTPDENAPVLEIDFTGHEKLLTNLQDHAAKKFRTPSNQLLYWLSNYELELNQR